MLLREPIYQGCVIEYQKPSAGSPGQIPPCVVTVNHHAQVQTLSKWHRSVGRDCLIVVNIRVFPVIILELSAIDHRVRARARARARTRVRAR